MSDSGIALMTDNSKPSDYYDGRIIVDLHIQI